MSVLAPRTVDDVVAALAERSDAQLLAGGTDFMVEVNFGHRRPGDVVALRGVDELRGWSLAADGTLTIGAGVTYRELMAPPLATLAPALAQASRTVGSPQIRNAGTLGGNLGTASPAGDLLPVLAAFDATIVIAGPGGRRRLRWDEFLVGPKQHALDAGEVIVGVALTPAPGPQEFLKVGTRNAMVISIASVTLVHDLDGNTIRCALGSVGPTPIRARAAEAWIAERAPEPPDEQTAREFGRRVASEARPIDDHRSTADYRRHAVAVCAGRALQRVFR